MTYKYKTVQLIPHKTGLCFQTLGVKKQDCLTTEDVSTDKCGMLKSESRSVLLMCYIAFTQYNQRCTYVLSKLCAIYVKTTPMATQSDVKQGHLKASHFQTSDWLEYQTSNAVRNLNVLTFNT
jgi:hypothetical protein